MAKGKGWHGDSAGHARAARKRGRKKLSSAEIQLKRYHKSPERKRRLAKLKVSAEYWRSNFTKKERREMAKEYFRGKNQMPWS